MKQKSILFCGNTRKKLEVRNDSFEVDIGKDQVLFRTGNEETAQKLKDELDVFLNISRYDDNILITKLDNATEVLGIDFFAPAVKKLLHKILADGNNCTVKLNWRRGTCTVKLPDEAIADTVRIELALNGFEIEQTGMTLAVGGIERLATYADVTFKKGFLDSIASIF